MNDIKQWHDAVMDKLRKHDANRLFIVAEIHAIQHECKHPNATRQRCGDYDGSNYLLFDCPDCGLRQEL